MSIRKTLAAAVAFSLLAGGAAFAADKAMDCCKDMKDKKACCCDHKGAPQKPAEEHQDHKG